MFGNENMTYVTDAYLQKVILGHTRSVSNLVRYIHFHEKHSENWNIRICNHNIEIYDEQGWRTVNTEYILDTLVLKYWEFLVNFYEKINRKDFRNKLISIETYNKLDRFVSDFKSMYSETFRDIKNDVYNTIETGLTKCDRFILISDDDSE